MRFRLEYKTSRSWFRNQLAMTLLVAIGGATGLGVAIHHAIDRGGNSYWALGIGFAAGLAPAVDRVVRAWRSGSGTMLIKDPVALSSAKRRNREVGRLLVFPAIASGSVLAFLPKLLYLFVHSFLGSFVFFIGLSVVYHFLRHHKEIEKLAREAKELETES